MATDPELKKTLDAPTVPWEYPWEAGEQIKACLDCLPWSVEFFFRDDADETPCVREWHAVGCDLWERLKDD